MLVWVALALSSLLMQWWRDWRREKTSTSLSLSLKCGPGGNRWCRQWWAHYAIFIWLYVMLQYIKDARGNQWESDIMYFFRTSMLSYMMPWVTSSLVETPVWWHMSWDMLLMIWTRRMEWERADLRISLRLDAQYKTLQELKVISKYVLL